MPGIGRSRIVVEHPEPGEVVWVDDAGVTLEQFAQVPQELQALPAELFKGDAKVMGAPLLSDEELAARRAEMESRGSKAWKPVNRERVVSQALKAYAALATSADRGAVRDVSQLDR